MKITSGNHGRNSSQVGMRISVGTKIREIRQRKGLSQGDIEHATGLLRCYTSRVENGHTVPSLETLAKFATALQIPMYEIFYSNDGGSARKDMGPRKSLEELAEGDSKESMDARFLLKLKTLLAHISDSDRQMLLTMARKLATH
jgi:transcriptional regulator with XRE-family HTH domain